MWLTILGVVIGLILLVVLIGALRPGDFRYQRKATMAASPGVVHAQVNDFKKWPAWSPWEKLDPNLKRTYSGAESGEGAQYHWVGNNQVGEGRMTIVESRPGEHIRIKLEFIKPFAAINDTLFTFEPQGNGTLVTWTMSGKNNCLARIMSMFMNMEKMIGGSFEKGLADMKKVTEGTAV